MNTEKNNDHLVEDHLQSLQGMNNAETKPFFYSRLRHRMIEKQSNHRQPVTFRPALVICALFLLLLANVYMITNQKDTVKQADTSVTSLQGFASSYNLTVSSY
jgi:hypothetical protein